MNAEPFHEGERAMHRRVGVEGRARRAASVVLPRLPTGIGRWLGRQRVAAVGVEGADGRLSATLLVGAGGFAYAPDPGTLILRAPVTDDDPLRSARPGGAVGTLLLDAARGERFRVNGVLLEARPPLLRIGVREAFPNCPRGVVRRRVGLLPRRLRGGSTRRTGLEASDRALLARADTAFLVTVHPTRGVDASHKAGKPGFVRAVGERRVAWPDRDGNHLLMSLGNLEVDARAALLVPDFERRSLLLLRGTAKVRFEPLPEAPDHPRHVVLDVEEVLFRTRAFRYRLRTPRDLLTAAKMR